VRLSLEANLGTLLRTCDAAGACMAVPDEIPMVGQGASLNVAVAGSLVVCRLAGLS
jgi:tRNA G18 (ribose-2'-O)-methylase SpoU